MHKLFREALNEARGVSEFIIAVVVDIRGFSAFSNRQESPDTAMFIKRVYVRLIDSYFPLASFYKSTGDGLLFTIPFDENNLQEVAQQVISSCISCHSEFANICEGDPMINFTVPDKVGIGLARGTACCLISGEKTIDYSGRLLNLATRLNDLARPSGIVIDGEFKISLLTDEQQEMFQMADVYLKGIHESEPISVYFTPEFTDIPKYNRQPISRKRWKTIIVTKPFREIWKFGVPYRHELQSEPTSADDIEVEIQHRMVEKGKVSATYRTFHRFYDFHYWLVAGKPTVVVDFAKLSEKLIQYQVKKNMNVTIIINYVEK